MTSSVFNDSWHQIAGLHLALAPSVVVQSQKLRGQLWFLLKDPYNDNFYKVTKENFQFIKFLSTEKTVEQIWEQYVEIHPELAPSREEVTLVIAQLHGANLLFFKNDADNYEITNYIKNQRRKELYSQITSILFFRLPLWNPNAFLTRVNSWTAHIPAIPVVVLWALVLLWGGAAFLGNLGAIYDKAEGVISLSNLPVLYVCMSVMKMIHEFAHGLLCKRYGGNVKKTGLMFLIFTPLPYVDVTSSWSFKNRWHRIWVGAAGISIELFIASIGAIIWSLTGPGVLNSVSFNLMLIGSVSSLVFNGNPLLRFDAYYVLSDYLEIPNLYQKAQVECLYLAEKYILRAKNIIAPTQDQRESVILVCYGIASYIYLMIVSFGISAFLLDRWFPIGLVSITVLLVTKFLLPYIKLVRYVISSATMAHRNWAYSIVVGIPLALLLFALYVPFFNSLKAPGSIEAENTRIYYSVTDGKLTQLNVHNGESVKSGQILMVLENPDLVMAQRIKQGEIDEAEIRYRVALFQAPNEIAPAQQSLRGLQQELAEINRKLNLLTVKASHDGIWVAPDISEYQGDWLRRGKVLGHLITDGHLRFSAVITQEQANAIFKNKLGQAKLKIEGQSGSTLTVDDVTLVPYRSDTLSSAALGWAGGGDIPTNVNDKDGIQTRESFFYLRANLPETLPANYVVLQGLSGVLLVALPPAPIGSQLSQFFRQMVQKRYGIQ